MQDQILSWILFLPLIGMAAILCVPKQNTGLIKNLSLVFTGLPLVLATWLYFGIFDKADAGIQCYQERAWIPLIGAWYKVVVDGLSDRERREFILADNRVAELAEWIEPYGIQFGDRVHPRRHAALTEVDRVDELMGREAQDQLVVSDDDKEQLSIEADLLLHAQH